MTKYYATGTATEFGIDSNAFYSISVLKVLIFQVSQVESTVLRA